MLYIDPKIIRTYRGRMPIPRGTVERGVYVDDLPFVGYACYKVIGSNGQLLMRSVIAESCVTPATEDYLWQWLHTNDNPEGTSLLVREA